MAKKTAYAIFKKHQKKLETIKVPLVSRPDVVSFIAILLAIAGFLLLLNVIRSIQSSGITQTILISFFGSILLFVFAYAALKA